MNIQPSFITSDEVDRRLRIVSELRNLCLSLGKAGREAKIPKSTPPVTGAFLVAVLSGQEGTANEAH